MSLLHSYNKQELMKRITGKLRRNFGRDVEEATAPHMFKACALVLRDIRKRGLCILHAQIL